MGDPSSRPEPVYNVRGPYYVVTPLKHTPIPVEVYTHKLDGTIGIVRVKNDQPIINRVDGSGHGSASEENVLRVVIRIVRSDVYDSARIYGQKVSMEKLRDKLTPAAIKLRNPDLVHRILSLVNP